MVCSNADDENRDENNAKKNVANQYKEKPNRVLISRTEAKIFQKQCLVYLVWRASLTLFQVRIVLGFMMNLSCPS